MYGKRDHCSESIPRFTFPVKDRHCQCLAEVTKHVGRWSSEIASTYEVYRSAVYTCFLSIYRYAPTLNL